MESNELQKLLKRQKAYMKAILVMTQKLYDIQTQISELSIKEIRKVRSSSKKKNADLLTVQEVCGMLNISKSTLYRMRVYDGLPFIKVEGRKNVMFKRSDIENYISKAK